MGRARKRRFVGGSPEDLLTSGCVAAVVGVSRQTVFRWLREFPQYRVTPVGAPGERQWHFVRRRDVEKLLAKFGA